MKCQMCGHEGPGLKANYKIYCRKCNNFCEYIDWRGNRHPNPHQNPSQNASKSVSHNASCRSASSSASQSASSSASQSASQSASHSASFSTSHSAKNPSTRKQNDNTHKCDICGGHYCTNANLERHKRCVHGLDRPFKCTVCTDAFTLNEYRRRHFVTVHCNGLTCHCGKRYRNLEQLRRCVAIHLPNH